MRGLWRSRLTRLVIILLSLKACYVFAQQQQPLPSPSPVRSALASLSQPVQGTTWVNIGPAPINPSPIPGTGNTRPASGRVVDVAVHPNDPNHWLIGASTGGVWQTLDAGATWTPLTDTQASLAMGAIAFAPSNPNIIYAGTGGERLFVQGGAGLLKSSDGGSTWTLLATSTFAKKSFTDIWVDPTNPNLLSAAIVRAFSGYTGYPPPIPPSGIFKSTDGGVTWAQKLAGQATDLEVDPSDFNRQYAGIGEVFGNAANGVYRSTDAGNTWTLINGPWTTMLGGVGHTELGMAPSNPNTLYVSIQDAADSVGNDGGILGLFRTDNAWDATPTWVQIPGATEYAEDIIVDPSDPNTLYYAGGVLLWKCTNCGVSPTWTEISHLNSAPLNNIHVDQSTMAWAGSRLIVGNDGGVWSTPDGGNTWADHNTNLSITQFYHGSIHPTNPNFAFGGSQDNGTEKWTGTSAWEQIRGGDGGANAISSSDPNNRWAVSFQNLGIQRTVNGGVSFSVADSGIDKTGVLFIAPIEECSSDDSVFIAGTDNLWRSNDFFSGVSPAWSSNGPEMASGISALAFALSDSTCNTYAFGTANGQLRLTTNGGTTWNDIDLGNVVPNRYVTDLAFDPTNANILYVTLAGFDELTAGQPGHVFKSTDALSPSPTWTNVSSPVNIPNNTIAVDPGDPNVLYVGTDLGIWKGSADGTTWIHMGPERGMPNVRVLDMKINDSTGRLVAFTYGRGAFVLTLPSVSITDVAASEGNSGTTPYNFTVTLSAASVDPVSVSFSSADGTATAGSDYVATAGTVTFNPGETNKIITVMVNGDTVPEASETFFVNLTSATNANIADGQGMGTIIDDDSFVSISCSSDSLQSAINNALTGQTLSVSGTCNENVLVRNDKVRVFLEGGGTATINASDPTRPAIDVRGKAVSIRHFTITGGSSGIEVERGSNAVIEQNIIQNTFGSGVAVRQQAFAVLTNNTIQNNAGDGVLINEGAAARIGFNSGSEPSPSPNTIQMNGGNGITIAGSSSARVVGADINNNGRHGIRVMSEAQADISNNAINSNGGDGINVTLNSSVQFGEDPGLFAAANSGTGNGGFGISCDFGAVLDGLRGTLTGNMGPTRIDPSCQNSLSP